MRTICKSIRIKRSDVLIAKPDQGRVMECVAAHSVFSHFLESGDFTRFADWRFIHRARLNLVPLNESSSWRAGDRRRRRCGYITKILAHVVDHCMLYTEQYMAWYNSVVPRIKKAAGLKYQNAIGTEGLRPDLVLKKETSVQIIDVTIPFDNHMAALKGVAKISQL
ncbi:uncharacterized protein LOC111027493 [Myzus persicae]|uniref:uncharacterized protein LOC111027493 n=1 Tax=Myzus persicae TaxID=13164 RepID=UPI000B931FE3|nr:uncharacterized protein LOC111027493 [Myzus persicae]